MSLNLPVPVWTDPTPKLDFLKKVGVSFESYEIQNSLRLRVVGSGSGEGQEKGCLQQGPVQKGGKLESAGSTARRQ